MRTRRGCLKGAALEIGFEERLGFGSWIWGLGSAFHGEGKEQVDIIAGTSKVWSVSRPSKKPCRNVSTGYVYYRNSGNSALSRWRLYHGMLMVFW